MKEEKKKSIFIPQKRIFSIFSVFKRDEQFSDEPQKELSKEEKINNYFPLLFLLGFIAVCFVIGVIFIIKDHV